MTCLHAPHGQHPFKSFSETDSEVAQRSMTLRILVYPEETALYMATLSAHMHNEYEAHSTLTPSNTR